MHDIHFVYRYNSDDKLNGSGRQLKIGISEYFFLQNNFKPNYYSVYSWKEQMGIFNSHII